MQPHRRAPDSGPVSRSPDGPPRRWADGPGAPVNAGAPAALAAAAARARRPGDGSRSAPRPRGPRAPPVGSLYDFGVIGDLHTAALISRFGSVDWACLPRFASPSVFARILDRHRGGAFAVAPVERSESEQNYLPSSNVLLTRFFLPHDRQLDLIDFMPLAPERRAEGLGMIDRIFEAQGGPIRVRISVDPRFDYGLAPAEWVDQGGAHVAHAGADRLWARAGVPLAARDGVLSGEVDLPAGQRTFAEVAWGGLRPTAETPEALLQSTTRHWQSWVHPATTPIHRIAGLWHAWVERSELVLKLLSHELTGAFVAAPTTSLPEWPGGPRNWDYRYVWVRDAAFTAQAFLLLGHLEEAERFLSWIVDRIAGEPQRSTPLRVMYDAHGGTDLAERELDHLDGYLRSRPVRVGNGAAGQFQLDIYGEFLDAARLLATRAPKFVAPSWGRLAGLADEVARRWREPDHGIWEDRGPPRQYVHSKLMAWVALDRSVDLAKRLEDEAAVARWSPVREEVRAWVLEHGFDERAGSFVQAEGESAVDAANLRIPLVGFLPYDDPRVRRTVARVERELAVGPFVYRYHHPDGLEGPEGSFLPAAFWLVECLARSGRRRRAFANWRRLLLAASPLGLYPEEYDPAARRPLGNYPQAFTHIGVLRAAVALGAADAPSVLAPSWFRS